MKLNISHNNDDKKELISSVNEDNMVLVEGNSIDLTCCTNIDAYPEPIFKWYKQHIQNLNEIELINTNNIKLNGNNFKTKFDICNKIELNLNRYDNYYIYKCGVYNSLNTQGLNQTLRLSVECKYTILWCFHIDIII